MKNNPGEAIRDGLRADPLIEMLASARPLFWNNPSLLDPDAAVAASGLTKADVEDAKARLERFAPYLADVFPETRPSGGIIESPLRPLPRLRRSLEAAWGLPLAENVYLKMDSHLPVSGSIKARGGLYEVLCRAERLALDAGLLSEGLSYIRLADADAADFFSGYSLAVGSTGNLGLSVGLMGATLGFRTIVHMSADARQWKKDMLRGGGVEVVEHAGDYSAAVAAGREQCGADPRCWFVDDENSRDLFLGYAVAGLRLAGQLADRNISVTPETPLVVYLPCGVGGGPGGIAFGLKLCFGDAVFCYFAEPTQAPAVALGLISGLGAAISAADIGLTGRTAADGLAVSRPSALACKAMRHMLNGVFTVEDEELFTQLHRMAESEDIRLEPSALAGVPGLLHSARGDFGSGPASRDAVHVVWATGGSFVPSKEWEQYDEKGRQLLNR